MFSRREVLRWSSLAATLPIMSTPAFSQAWPAKDIHLICLFAPGTSPDTLTRVLAKSLQEVSKQNVIVENKVGAFGNIASEYVARSKPDGYTIYIAPGGSALAAAPHLFKKLSFDPLNDFEHVTTLATLPFVLLVAGAGPFKNVADLVAHLKERGDKASYGSVANSFLLSSELFKQQFNLPTVEVKYKEPFTMMQDVVAGNLAFTHLDWLTASGYLKDGRVRAIATTTKERSKALPDIPSAGESGIANTDVSGLWSVHVAKGTPKPVVDQLETWFNGIVATAEYKKLMDQFGWDALPGNSQMLRERLILENQRWAEYVKIAKIEAQ